ncbi:hypothetical protein [Brucella intermedia]|uniref:DUF340 domain-containing protein n=1 Tax=Brucella intermedia TaxID=94625 RepID=A0A7V6TXN8_9HYPH|nr:hypothetical protein [Brucella intermedia]WGG60943.1 hypothetical protein QA414_19750 [Brucella intermedia]HHV66036.1 hypothetical protein [Brucella intermedia]
MTSKSVKNTIDNLTLSVETTDERKIDIVENALLLVIACFLGLVANWVGTGVTPAQAVPGMAVLYAASIGGLILARYMPFYLPSVAWVSLIAIVVTIPGVPGSEFVLAKVGELNFLALATPALAYGGLALTRNEFEIARRSGWKIVVVAICVMIGTYLGSVIIADLTLRITG